MALQRPHGSVSKISFSERNQKPFAEFDGEFRR